MNNKVNKVKLANCLNEGYEFPVEEVDYENMVWNEDKEVITKNNKDSPNEQLAGLAEAPRQRPWMARSREHVKDTANYYWFSLQIISVWIVALCILYCAKIWRILLLLVHWPVYDTYSILRETHWVDLPLANSNKSR